MNSPSPQEVMAALRASLTDVELLKQENSRLREGGGEPIAIVGMSCRYPGGVGSPEQLWELVADRGDAISPFPTDRGWDLNALAGGALDAAGGALEAAGAVGDGGFLDDVAGFDAAFFGIGPREAQAMDPQQRLLLEVCWEALESVGIGPRSLRNSATGVFAGISLQDYLQLGQRTPEALLGYRLTGGSAGVVSGRIAYALGLQGPTVTIDTACSSSLVSLHLACQSLRCDECSLALAGGVTVLATPALFVEFSRQGGLAPDGRCKPFAHGADGTSLAEGVGVLVLERLSEAQRNGHPVLAVVRGSAVNQDGESNGLTAPNGLAQQQVIARALANAGLSPADVDAVEAHGTGTTLGDPIEAHALLRAYGSERDPAAPLWIGSVKSNIGHTQAAAGVAGVIKMVMALRNGVLPPTLHVDAPSQQVEWSSGAVSLLLDAVAWPSGGRARRVGVSSFGISGTNAHVILEEAPSAPTPLGSLSAARDGEGGPDRETGPDAVPLAISAKEERALRAQAVRLQAHLEASSEPTLSDIGASLAARCSGFAHRAVVLAASREALAEQLSRLAGGVPSASVIEGVVGEHGATAAVLFTGQGAQRTGMGSELYRSFPAFREALDEACGHLDELLECSLRALMFGELQPSARPSARPPHAKGRHAEARATLDDTRFTQAALFALELSLFRLLESGGVRVSFVAGHSIGELVAACVAGALPLDGACAIVAARGRLMAELADDGAMVAVQASESEALERLDGLSDRVALAAVNGPRSVVLSGEREAVLGLAAGWEREGRKTKRLQVSHAFHSPLMDGMLEEFERVVEGVTFGRPRMAVLSNVSGEELTAEQLCDPGYWVRHARETVRFADCVRRLVKRGVGVFLELGPDAALSPMVRECISGDGLAEPPGDGLAQPQPVVASLLRSGRPEQYTLMQALAQTWVSGVEVDWRSVLAAGDGRIVGLPTYPFQRERYWVDGERGWADPLTAGALEGSHPLLKSGVALADGGWLFTGSVSLQEHPWLGDHVVCGRVLLPGTVLLELALHAGAQLGCETVRELVLQAPLTLSEGEEARLQVRLAEPDAAGACAVSIHSSSARTSVPPSRGWGPADEPQWVCHALGSLAATDAEGLLAGPDRGRLDATIWPPAGVAEVPAEDVYGRFAELGFQYGPAFRGLVRGWSGDGEAFAEVALPTSEISRAGSFAVHPALLDAALHAIAIALDENRDGGAGSALPFSWSDVSVARRGAGALRVRLRRNAHDALSLIAHDEQGRMVVSVGSLRTRPFSARALESRQGTMLALEWVAHAPAVSGDGRPDDDPGGEQSAAVELLDTRTFVGDAGTDGAPICAQRTASAVKVALQRTLESLQGLLADERLAESRLVVLTEGALGTGDEAGPADLAASAIWGLVRGAQWENPGRIALIDVGREERSGSALPLALSRQEPQLALRDGQVLVPRLTDVHSHDRGLLASPPRDGAWRLDIERPGSFEGLALLPDRAGEAPLAPGEVRVAVRAAGLNFRDVLVGLGVYPGEGRIGSEAAGVVVEVGETVRGLAPGDRVMGLVDGAIGPLAVADSRLLVPMPAGWTFTQAASVPIAHATACYALCDLARLKSGERVLIHSGAGGVGMAAVQLARRLGAEVFATANPGKWDRLRALGVEQGRIASSRTLDFKDELLAATGGSGMDVVLNSLAGEFVDASLALLSDGGRFLEMGKTDVRDPELLLRERGGVEYRAFDLTEAGPDRLHEILAELVELFERGALQLSPLSTWSVRRAPQALRRMSRGGHVGKNVLRMPPRIDAHGTVLVTGAGGGIGSLLARHLVVEHGVRQLLLVSRSGARAEGAAELLAELERLGAQARIERCDVSDRDGLRTLLASISPEHPLDAVFHAAGVLDDGVIGALTAERLDRVLAAKVQGALNLHELTASSDLSAFVLFSSIAGVLGSPGQAAYAAANSCMDALAAQRRELGLPGISIAWGLWDRGGAMTATIGALDRARIAKLGVRPLAAEDGLALLDEALALDEPLVVAARLDSGALAAQARGGELHPVLSRLLPARPQVSRAAGTLAQELAQTAEERREGLVLDLIRSEAAHVLGHDSPQTLPSGRSFKEMGFDSLAGVELRNRLAARAGVPLPATLVFDHPTPAELARHLIGEIAGRRTVGAVAARRGPREAPREAPVAIVGMACRYPGGVSSPAELWQLLREGRDAISSFPADRGWESQDERGGDSEGLYRREGGFVYDAAEFDAAFFGISPREALAMDPQQRLLLEACWEALEDAFVDPRSLHGSQTGVFVGIGAHDYHRGAPGMPPALRGHGITGGSGSVASGRISYSLGLQGPAMTVDTACSSSLVALHLACQALRGGECSLALAGGAAVISSLALFSEFAHQQGLASDARCKAFAHGADGVGWGEGVGVLALERLSDARRSGRPVLALIRGSAVNHDGASNGLTAPNGPSQQRVIMQALSDAGLQPHEVDAVEAHGTGTRLGDPIEAQAIIATYGQSPRERPLWLGSVKSNIGHTQAAAGMAGVIKMAMALSHGVLPRTLHAREPSREIDWSAGAVALLSEETPWPTTGRPPRAAVSSFGISGTNAHVILEGAPAAGSGSPGRERACDDSSAQAPPAAPERDRRLGLIGRDAIAWVLSGREEAALRDQGARLLERVAREGEHDPLDVALSLAHRPRLQRRAVVVSGEQEGLLRGLRSLAAGEPAPVLLRGAAAASDGGPGVAFVLPGQGSQWIGMGRELLDRSPVFAERVSECAAALEPFTDWSLLDVLRGGGGAAPLERVDVVQPALFAVMVALGRLWEACGVRPEAVVGHSQGEIAAVCVAGGLSLEDAARLVALRSRALTTLSGEGGMASVALPPSEIEGWLGGFGGELSLAAVNGPAATVVSGAREPLARLLARCTSEGVKGRELPVDYAAHSPHVERIRSELLEACASLQPRSGDIRFYSSVSGGSLDMAELDAEYWYRNLRETVQFEQATQALLASGCGVAIEVSPHPVLTMAVQETAERAPGAEDVAAVGSLRREDGGAERFLRSLGEAWTRGVEVDWARLLEECGAQRTALPTYAFQRERFWFEPAPGGSGGLRRAGLAAADHPLLGAAVELAQEDGWVFSGRLSLDTHPWLEDHAVLGAVLVPATVLLDLALHAGARVGCAALRELAIESPLALAQGVAVQLQVVLKETGESGAHSVAIYSRAEPERAEGDLPPVDEAGTGPGSPDAAGWRRHAQGTLAGSDAPSPEELAAGELAGAWPPAGAQPLELDDLYDRLADRGFEYGPAFQNVRAMWRCGEQLLAEVALPGGLELGAEAFAIDPLLLDAALHPLARVADERDGAGGVRLPFAWSEVRLNAPAAAGARRLRVALTLEGESSVALAAVDETGASVISVGSLRTRELSPEQLERNLAARPDALHRLQWRAVGARGAHLGGEHPADLGGGEGVEQPAAFADLQSLRDALLRAGEALSTPPVVLLDWSHAEPPAEPPAEASLPLAAHERTARALELVQEWLAEERLAGSLLVFLTRGAVAAGSGEFVPTLDDAPLWGLVRSAQLEAPGRFGLIDLDGDDPRSRAAVPAAAASIACGQESQLAIRDGVVHAPRLVRGAAGALVAPAGGPDGGEGGWRLALGGARTLDDLAIVSSPARREAPLEPSQVRLEVRAAGMNFRDAVLALGIVSAGESIGSEGAGVVLEVGPGVEDLAVGDRVMGLFGDAFASHAIADRRLLVPVPRGWSFAQAAAVPSVFLTAFYGLVDLAGCRRGERVLVHAAAGGVGMAALQLARWLGAEVLATASPGKWEVLRELGIDDACIASSRDPRFNERLLAGGGAGGVDVVLNSLAGEFVEGSLDMLRPGGRFLEMGKTDIRDPQQIAARWPNVSYRAFDLGEAGRERIGEVLRELLALFEQGVLRHLPLRAWDMRRAPEALRFMAQARHVGKIVLTLPARGRGADGTILITGGTGVLGGLLARHLVERHGARNLLLVSRQGSKAPGARRLRTALAELGAEVQVRACDVAQRPQLERLLASIPAQRPLRAVVHAAGVLDDGPLQQLSGERLDSVLAAKLDGAWHLHELTRDRDLEAFVLFSSAAGVIGSPGQANYAAANAFLDALAAHRRAQGLAGVSLAWGLWEQQTGLTGGLREIDRARIRRSGIVPLRSDEGLELLDAAWTDPDPLTLALRLERANLRARAQAGELPPLLRALAGAAPRARSDRDVGELAARLAGAPPEERRRVVLTLVCGEVAAVLGHSSPEAVDARRPLKELGFDSLLAVELRNRLSTASGVQLAATLAFDHPTAEAVTDHLLERLLERSGAAGGAGDGGLDPERLRVELSALSAHQARRLGFVEQLRGVLSRWEAAEGAELDEPGEQDLVAASDEEIFELIDRELAVGANPDGAGDG